MLVEWRKEEIWIDRMDEALRKNDILSMLARQKILVRRGQYGGVFKII